MWNVTATGRSSGGEDMSLKFKKIGDATKWVDILKVYFMDVRLDLAREG